MKKFTVYGTVPIGVIITVEAEDAESAIEAAYEEFDGLSNYAGNGGLDKIVGTRQVAVSLDATDAEPKFTEADEVGS